MNFLYGYTYYGIDPYYLLLILPVLALSMFVQWRMRATFNKYSKVFTRRGVTGAQAAEAVLRQSGVYNVPVGAISGDLNDHFDPRNKTISLSMPVYGVASVAAVGVAAHEAGHALQYQNGYGPIKLRAAIIPVTRIGSMLSFPLFLIGLMVSNSTLIWAGIGLFALSALFQLVTLPVEFDASRRALRALREGHILDESELPQAKKVLTMAAMTYVVALLMSLAQLTRLILIAGRNSNRR